MVSYRRNQMKILFLVLFLFVVVLIIVFQDKIYRLSNSSVVHSLVNNEPDEHRVGNNEPDEHRLGNNQFPKHRLVNDEPVEQRILNDQPVGHRLLNNEPDEHRLVNNQFAEQRLVNNEPVEQHILKDQPVEHRQVNNESGEHRLVNNEPDEHRLVNNEPVEHRLFNNQLVEHRLNIQPVEHRLVNNSFVKNRLFNNQPVGYRLVNNEPVTHRLVNNQPVKPYDLKLDLPMNNINNVSLPLVGKDQIPPIIHQSWKNSLIPLIFQPWILSWRKNHPEWSYYFWTDIDLTILVRKRFPKYRQLFDNYQTQIERVDVAKYMILYEYGGLFADLDMLSLKPIDKILQGNALVLVKEPWIHSNLYGKTETIVSNAIMASRPKHPYLRWVLEHLHENVKNPSRSVSWRTGPRMLTRELERYEKAFPVRSAPDRVRLLEHYVFIPKPDPVKEQNAKAVCKEWKNLEQIQKIACRRLNNGTYRFLIDPDQSYADHKWICSYRHIISIKPGDIVIDELLGSSSKKFRNPVEFLNLQE